MAVSSTSGARFDVSPCGPWRSGWRQLTLWTGVLVLAAGVLAVAEYRSRDPDSALHAALAARLAAEPAGRLIAPQWWGNWGRQDLYREHPVGILVPPALLGKAGYPPAQAAYAINALYQVVSLVLLARLAAWFAAGPESRALVWLLQLIPIAFTYRIRANHEQAVLMCLLLALYATERSRERPAWTILTTAAIVALAVIKGVLAVLAILACVWWLIVRRPGDSRRRAAPWLGLALAAAGIVLAAGLYEHAYRQVTGESFLGPYLSVQLGRAVEHEGGGLLAQKAYNFVWYLARLLYFALPWSVVAFVAIGRERVAIASWARGSADAASGNRRHGLEGLVFAIGAAILSVAALSVSDRRADRYIFPAYYLIAAAGAVAGIRRWRALRDLVRRSDAFHPFPAAAVWLVTFFLSLIGHTLRVPRINIRHFLPQ